MGELAGHPCIKRHAMDGWPLVRGGHLEHCRVDGPFAANTVDAVRAAAVAGIGIAMTTDRDVHEQYANGESREVVLEDARRSGLGTWAVYLSRSHLPTRVKALVEACARDSIPTGASSERRPRTAPPGCPVCRRRGRVMPAAFARQGTRSDASAMGLKEPEPADAALRAPRAT